ncbi:AmiS/UreI family transporter [Zafaria sp. Z1313]|uniref:AmiS/UreI family transporter n=1 Tax=unclassified Zafaria TaxID=2828765 RepID=UPI002E77BD1E|nr:AmiS/UreI family transporter [Zafaria sp. J156]MEE1621736.1 AmiS/UreI family transporter [Zafaria sp. J156]
MGSVGLLYVGAVLFLNGLMLLGKVPAKAAAPINFFVGVMQVVFPTIIISQSGGDPAVILGASGLYLFGFTYLYVALDITFDLDGAGLGWFSLFVAVVAAVMGYVQFTLVGDPVFGVIWLLWAVLWLLFFLLLGLKMDALTTATGWFTVVVAHITATIPALLLLTGQFQSTAMWATVLAVVGAVALVGALAAGRRGAGSPASGDSTAAAAQGGAS